MLGVRWVKLPDSNFRQDVEMIMATIPYGRVITYGDIAAFAGHPYASRIVGGIAHYGDASLPWHRLVNRFGGLARGFPGGMEVQAQLLAQEGISCTDYIVDDFKGLRWQPNL
jgi:methylated-DNA-protein-cysteine methyltransferase-like protein